MKLTHGSQHSIAAEEGFDLLDYKLKEIGKGEGAINNGHDAYGPGIYTWTVNEDESGSLRNAIDMAMAYSGDKGVVYVLNLNIEEEDLLNNRPPDEIPVEDWARAINNFMDRVREQQNYVPEKVSNSLDYYWPDDSSDKPSKSDLKFMENNYPGLSFEYADPDEFDEPYEWKEAVLENYRVESDPMDHILNEGGAEGVADWSMNRSDNLWETLTSIWNTVAVNNTGTGTESFNKTFKEAILEELNDDYGITAAKVEEGAITVVFDTSEINIQKVLPVQKTPEQNLSIVLE